MTQHEFEASEWVERLAQALEVLTKFVANRINSTEFTNDQFREFAKHDKRAQSLFESYFRILNTDLTDAVELIREHPVIQSELTGKGDGAAVMMVMPGKAFRVEFNDLVQWLAISTIKKGGKSAAKALGKYLTLSDEKLLPGYEITLFCGLEIDGKVEIGEGAYIASYDEIVRLGLIKEQEREERPWDDTPDYSKMGALAFVREFTWGPGVEPPMSGLGSLEGTRRKPDVTFSYLNHKESLEIIFDFLAVATRHKVDILSIQTCGAKFMEDIDPNFGLNSKTRFMVDRMWDKKKFSEQDQLVFRESLNNWEKFKKNRDTIDLVIRRLVSSLSRRGRFGLQDSILDVSIALEIMYQLGSTELTYKLATRAGYFLGSNPEERNEIFDSVKAFYRTRSSIIHGGTKNIDEIKTIFNNGFDLARDTLLKLLRMDLSPNWDKLVMLGAVQ